MVGEDGYAKTFVLHLTQMIESGYTNERRQGSYFDNAQSRNYLTPRNILWIIDLPPRLYHLGKIRPLKRTDEAKGDDFKSWCQTTSLRTIRGRRAV
jgi:hypothetical protein